MSWFKAKTNIREFYCGSLEGATDENLSSSCAKAVTRERSSLNVSLSKHHLRHLSSFALLLLTAARQNRQTLPGSPVTPVPISGVGVIEVWTLNSLGRLLWVDNSHKAVGA